MNQNPIDGGPNKAAAKVEKPEKSFSEQLVELRPAIRRFAGNLCGNPSKADDLTQDTMVRALENQDKFKPGTNMRAWLMVMARNLWYSKLRKEKRVVEDPEGALAAKLSTEAGQDAAVDLAAMREALMILTDEQRAIIMLSAEGNSYLEIAEVFGIPVGTVKSKINRARKRLKAKLEGAPLPQDTEGDDVPEGGDAEEA